MYGHVTKHVKMHIKPMGGTNKRGKKMSYGAEKGINVHETTGIMAMHPKRATFEQGLMGVGCNQTRSSSRRAPNMARPGTREANTSIKHRRKQA